MKLLRRLAMLAEISKTVAIRSHVISYLRLVPRRRMCSCFAMYIEAVPNRNSPPAILLRESYREGGKVRKRTLCNLSDWPTAHIEGLRGVLRGGTVISAEDR